MSMLKRSGYGSFVENFPSIILYKDTKKNVGKFAGVVSLAIPNHIPQG